MDFIKKVSEKTTQAAQMLTKKTNKLVEVTKLNMAVSENEEKLKSLFQDIGKAVYTSTISEADETNDFSSEFAQIEALYSEIEELNKTLLELKNMQACKACGQKVQKIDQYCKYCGKRVD